MSLASQISAAVSAIGAAIKASKTTIPAKSITADYTVSNADAGYELQVNSAVAVTITVPSSGVTFGNVVLVRQIGAGQVTISGATVKKYAATTKLAGQNALASVRFDSSTAVYVSGELAAS